MNAVIAAVAAVDADEVDIMAAAIRVGAMMHLTPQSLSTAGNKNTKLLSSTIAAATTEAAGEIGRNLKNSNKNKQQL